jgi:fatty-acyl-CoA synthase
LGFVLNDAGARFLFLEQQFLPLVEALRQTVPSIEEYFLLDGQPQARWLAPANYEKLLVQSEDVQCDIRQVDEDSLAELFYTSGTSDTPKGVMLSHRNIYLHALSVIVTFQTSRMMAGQTSCETAMLHTIPLFHANGWGTAHTITLVGGTHVMMHHFNPAEVCRLVEQEGVVSCAMVPTMVNALINFPERVKYDLSSLRSIMIGGAASSPTLVRENNNLFC